MIGARCACIVSSHWLEISHKASPRTKRLKELSNEKKTMIFYESPHRILKTLTDFSNYFNDESLISVSRELTKLFEETFRGTIKESIEHFEKNKPKGEFVIVLSPK